MNLSDIIKRIDVLKSEIDLYRPFDKEAEERLMQKFRLDWNYHSNSIEGNTLSYGETIALLNWGITAQGKPLIDHIQMKGHNEAINYILVVIKGDERKLSEVFIRDIHTLILRKEPYQIDAIISDGKSAKRWVYPGKYKSQSNHVLTPTGEIFYFASPEETPAKMQELLKWFSENEKNENPLILAASCHYQFVRIHPFDDGNGRVARILMNFIFMLHGLAPAIIKTVKKNDYYNALALADGGDLEKFIEYIGEQEINSLELMLKAAKGEIIVEQDDFEKQIATLKKKIDGNEEK